MVTLPDRVKDWSAQVTARFTGAAGIVPVGLAIAQTNPVGWVVTVREYAAPKASALGIVKLLALPVKV